MTLTAKELIEKLKELPDDTDVIVVIGKEGLDGDITDVKYDGAAILEVVI